MPFDRAAADAILKNLYLGPVREQLNLSTPLLAEVQRSSEEVVGKQAIVPLHVQRSEAVGARADGGSLPTANKQKYVQATFPVKYQYGRIEVTLPTIESTKSDAGAFVRAVDSETKGLMAEFKEDFNRQLAANNATADGTLAVFAANASSTTLNLIVASQTVTSARRLRPGLVIDLQTAGVVNGTRTIVSVTLNASGQATAIVVDSAIATTSGDLAVRTGNYQNECIGLPGIVAASGILHGVDPATYPVWKATDLNNSGTPRALSEDLMQQVVDAVAIASGEEPGAIVAEHTQRRKFYALLTSMKHAVNTTELKGGFTALTFDDNKPILVDRFVDADKMFFINKDHIKIYEMSDWNWADQDGAILSRVSGKPSFEAFLYKFCEFGTDKRSAHGVLKDLS